MKSMSVNFEIPYIFVEKNEKTVLVPSMVLSTLSVCVLVTFFPALMPIWIARATHSWI
jgi:hypothetical protein